MSVGKGLTSFDVFEALAQHGVIVKPGDDFQVAPIEEVHEGVGERMFPVRITFTAATYEQINISSFEPELRHQVIGNGMSIFDLLICRNRRIRQRPICTCANERHNQQIK